MKILVGDEHINCTPWIPYDDRVCDLLDEWSKKIREDRDSRSYPDVLTFGFFIRKGSVAKKKSSYEEAFRGLRIGRGLAFHIAPSNVPVNCMYTLVFGLLAGCANIVRVPSKEFTQVDILCRTLSEVIKQDKYRSVGERMQVLSYDRDEKNLSGTPMTEFFSSVCDVRVIWGGDETVNHIRCMPVSPRTKEITFSDRYSIGIISTAAVTDSSDDELERLASDFYNDTYLMDQNACSTPHLIAWRDDAPNIERAQERFWKAVAGQAMKYELADIKVSDKFADLCEVSGQTDSNISNVIKYTDNLLYVCNISKLSADTASLCRGRYGMFFQKVFNNLDELKSVVDDSRVQTCAVYGIEPREIAEWVVKSEVFGIDRVVPFGKTLDIGVVWDGYNLIDEMSRVVEF